MSLPHLAPPVERTQSPFSGAAGAVPQSVTVHGEYKCQTDGGSNCGSGCMAGTGNSQQAAYNNAYNLATQQCQSTQHCHLTNFTNQGTGGCT